MSVLLRFTDQIPVMSHPETPDSWIQSLRRRGHEHRKHLFTLLIVGVVLVFLWILALSNPMEDRGYIIGLAFLGGLAGFVSTALGAIPALILTRLQQRTEDIMLGGAAGMMLAASSFSLIVPGIEAGESLTGHLFLAALLVAGGMIIGVMLMLGLESLTPHEHFKIGPAGPGHERYARVWLFVFAIALHNLPEGMAVGFGFSQGDLSVGIPLTIAIAIQNLPEGLAVAMSLRTVGVSRGRAFWITAATGVLEPLGALIGVSLVGGSALAYPIGLGLAAGAMIFVVSHEVIPETHRNNHQRPATIGLMGGFILMMVLDMALE